MTKLSEVVLSWQKMLTTLYASALALVAQPTVPAGRPSGAVATRTSDVLMINLFGNNGAQASCRLRMKHP